MLLFLHVTAAFATVAGVVFIVALLIATSRVATPLDSLPYLRLSLIPWALVNLGGVAALVFGVWLAIYVDGYELWDGWIVAALVLWVIASFGSGPAVRAYREALAAAEAGDAERVSSKLHTRRTVALHAVSVAAVGALLAVMIYKPGA